MVSKISENKLKDRFRKLIDTEGTFIEEKQLPGLEFVLIFSYPKSPNNPGFQVIKAENQEFVQLNCRINFKPEEIQKLANKNEFKKLGTQIRKVCLMRDIEYNLQRDDKTSNTFVIMFNRLKLTVNNFDFWKELKHLYFTFLYIGTIFGEIFQGVIQEKIDDTKSSGTDLYI